MPGLAPTHLLSFLPGTLQLTVSLGVVVKQLQISLIRKPALPQSLFDLLECILKKNVLQVAVLRRITVGILNIRNKDLEVF